MSPCRSRGHGCLPLWFPLWAGVLAIPCPAPYTSAPPGCSEAWSSRLLWEQKTAGSNPAIPTTGSQGRGSGPQAVFISR